ncbi:MAG TPA: thioredoxin [Clostridiaceae bacterium]|nr:thioredoxin [Clostridiaceae bacterium]
MAGDKVLTITKENFEEEVLKSDIPVLVDFWASWCGPCRAIAPIIDELADDFSGKAKVGKINVDEQGELAQKFRIMSIPTIMLFKGGQSVEKVVGARPKEDFAALIEKNL